MKLYRKTLCLMALFLSALFIVACVTINIYFPAEKVESVAGKIVNEIRGQQSGEEEKSLQKDKKSSLSGSAFALLCSPAWADEVTSVSNPVIRALKDKMRNRYGLMKPYYQKRVLKEEGSGYVTIGSSNGLSLKEKRDLKNLMQAENKDRERLYQEIAKALKIDSSQTQKIAEIFAKEWQKSVQ